MSPLIILSALVAVACAAPGYSYVGAPAVYQYAAPVSVVNQYHAQDVLGQYSYGYSGGPSSKTEFRSVDGSVAGGYSYVDGEGKVQNVQYTADSANGFRVAASNLPVAPAPIDVPAVEAPKPVEDTVEVVKARAEHLATFEEVKNRKIEEVVAPFVAPVVAPIAYSAPQYSYTPYVSTASTGYAYTAPSSYAYTAPSSYAYTAPSSYAYTAPSSYAYTAPSSYAYTAPSSYAYTAPSSYAYTAPSSYAYTAPSSYAYTAPAPIAPVTYSAIAPVSSQYHAQDELGQYSYGYAGGLSAKSESKSFDGVTRGGYSYVDANGLVQNVQYTADAVNGFRVAATNLPVAPVADSVAPLVTVADTEEVAAAKSAHFAAHVEANERTAKALL